MFPVNLEASVTCLEKFFSFNQYNLRQFTDTNSVICKIIVGSYRY